MPWSQYGLRALPDGAPVFREAREKLKFARSFPNAREIIARTPRFPSPQSPSPSWPNACGPGSALSKLLNDIDALMVFLSLITGHWSLVTVFMAQALLNVFVTTH